MSKRYTDANGRHSANPALGDEPAIGIDAAQNYIRVPRETLTRGLAIVGQSGCGKSFLLGRLLEEILRTTENSRILVLDCNSDFFCGLDPKPSGDFRTCKERCIKSLGISDATRISLWEDEAYENMTRNAKVWASDVFYGRHIVEAVRTSLPKDSQLIPHPLTLNWHWVASNVWRFLDVVKGGRYSPSYLWQLRSTLRAQPADVPTSIMAAASEVEKRMTKAQSDSHRQGLEQLYTDLLHQNALGIWDDKGKPPCIGESKVPSVKWLFPSGRVSVLQLESLGGPHVEAVTVMTILKQLVSAQKYVLAQARLAELAEGEEARDRKLESFTESGEFARTFVVVDEVQRFAPDDTDSPHLEAVTNNLLEVAAEARKYGIHLILATQRPGKVKRGLLGECSSAIIMKMNSRSDLVQLADQMRILDVKLLEHTLHFQGFGNAIAAGEITQRPPSTLLFKSAPRRSREGGVDLRMY